MKGNLWYFQYCGKVNICVDIDMETICPCSNNGFRIKSTYCQMNAMYLNDLK